MYSQRVVFIIGAGASCEFNMPTGLALKTNIANALNNEEVRIKFQIGGPQGDTPTWYDAADELAKVIEQFDSIDEALHWFSPYAPVVLLGKQMIVKEILRAERQSRLFEKADPDVTPLRSYNDVWATYFLRMAIASTKKDDICKAFSNVTIINFNYDRTVEHFLYSELQRSLGADKDNTKQAISGLRIIRPYGSVGPLPWQSESGVLFGQAVDDVDSGDRIWELSKSIRTFTEQKLSSDVKSEIENVIQNAQVIIILGFCFHQQNMQLLSARSQTNKMVIATVLGISNENHERMHRLLMSTFRISTIPQLLSTGCHQLLQMMKPSLMPAI
jgi:hypothetical protein